MIRARNKAMRRLDSSSGVLRFLLHNTRTDSRPTHTYTDIAENDFYPLAPTA